MQEHANGTVNRIGSTVRRRDVLKGMAAVGATAVGASAASDRVAAGTITGGCVDDWPDPIEDRIDISGDEPVEHGDVPSSGEFVIYVHGLFSEDVLDSIDINGANQAAAVEQALEERGVDQPVVAAMWDSTTDWWTAKDRADEAGKTLATWIDDNHWFADITIIGHSLGSRVTLKALNELSGWFTSIESAALLGGAVDPDTVCSQYQGGIEGRVDDTVYNYHSGDDDIVCTIYAIAEDDSGIGCVGADCNPDDIDSFEQVDLTGDVLGHCNYHKPDGMDFNGTSAMEEIYENHFED